jgi:hypothetical protein
MTLNENFEFVEIYGRDTFDISNLLRELRSSGYHAGKDFDFEYVPGKFDYNLGKNIPRHTKFYFYNKALASWFILKYT